MAIIKHRYIHFEKRQIWTGFKSYESLLKMQDGVKEAKIDYEKYTLYVVYDLDKINFRSIGWIVKKEGLVLSDSIWRRLQRRFIHFFEENEYDNAHAEALPCCSNPDRILRETK